MAEPLEVMATHLVRNIIFAHSRCGQMLICTMSNFTTGCLSWDLQSKSAPPIRMEMVSVKIDSSLISLIHI